MYSFYFASLRFDWLIDWLDRSDTEFRNRSWDIKTCHFICDYNCGISWQIFTFLIPIEVLPCGLLITWLGCFRHLSLCWLTTLTTGWVYRQSYGRCWIKMDLTYSFRLDLEQLSYMAGHVTNPATKLEYPTPIRSWVELNGSHRLPLKMPVTPLRMRRIVWTRTYRGSKNN